jgi:hypothetical protein
MLAKRAKMPAMNGTGAMLVPVRKKCNPVVSYSDFVEERHFSAAKRRD